MILTPVKSPVYWTGAGVPGQFDSVSSGQVSQYDIAIDTLTGDAYFLSSYVGGVMTWKKLTALI